MRIKYKWSNQINCLIICISIRLVFFIDSQSLKSEKGGFLREALQMFSSLVENFKDIKYSSTFIFTHTSDSRDSER